MLRVITCESRTGFKQLPAPDMWRKRRRKKSVSREGRKKTHYADNPTVHRENYITDTLSIIGA